MKRFNSAFKLVFETNVLDAFVPEVWANESLAILEENMVVASLVYRDFSDEVANFGDIVNTRRPGEYEAKRKGTQDDVMVQDSTAENIQVPLNQHVHVSFIIRDGEESLSFKDLVPVFVQPAMLANARFIDQILLGQYPAFLGNAVGGLGQLSSTNAKSTILDSRNAMNIAKAPVSGRNAIWTPASETDILNTDIFLTADKVGDGGMALREASIGRKLGFDHYMAQNTPFVDINGTVDVVTTGTVDHAAGYAAGYTGTITYDTGTLSPVVGAYVVLPGDEYPQAITATGTLTFTIAHPLAGTVADGVNVTYYKPGTVNNASGYAAGYSKEIALDGFTSGKFLQPGQIIAFGTSTSRRVYTVVQVTSASGTNQTVILDRPLDLAIADGDAYYPGPAGAYNLAFCRNAMALVTRPLARPQTPGTRAAVANYNGLSMRACISYDPYKQGHLVTLDFLCGVAILDANQGNVILG